MRTKILSGNRDKQGLNRRHSRSLSVMPLKILVITSMKKGITHFLSAICVLVLLSALVWFAIAQWKYYQELIIVWQERVDNIEHTLKDLDQNFSSFKTKINNRFNSENEISDRLATLEASVTEQAQHLAGLKTSTRSDFLLTEASRLIRIANQHLSIGRSKEKALALLTEIDDTLNQIDTMKFQAIRASITEDLAMLNSTEYVDVDEIYMELGLQILNIRDLKFFPDKDMNTSGVSMDDTNGRVSPQLSSPSQDKSIWEMIARKFSNLIVVKSADFEPELALNTQQELIIHRMIVILVEQAQTALLYQDSEIYRSTLLKAENYLNEYFYRDSNSKGVSDKLRQLADRDIIQESISIERSYNAIQQVLTNQHQTSELLEPDK